MKSIFLRSVRENDVVVGLYPAGGNRNILRKFSGKVLEKKTGPQGWRITVQEAEGKIRSFLNKKISGKIQVLQREKLCNG